MRFLTARAGAGGLSSAPPGEGKGIVTRTDLTGADGEHWRQAVESLLPTALRAPWGFSPAPPEPGDPGRDDTRDEIVTTAATSSRSQLTCRCGCGELPGQAPAGRTKLFVDHAHRERAYRARKNRRRREADAATRDTRLALDRRTIAGASPSCSPEAAF